MNRFGSLSGPASGSRPSETDVEMGPPVSDAASGHAIPIQSKGNLSAEGPVKTCGGAALGPAGASWHDAARIRHFSRRLSFARHGSFLQPRGTVSAAVCRFTVPISARRIRRKKLLDGLDPEIRLEIARSWRQGFQGPGPSGARLRARLLRRRPVRRGAL
jgi:hypothetical protein